VTSFDRRCYGMIRVPQKLLLIWWPSGVPVRLADGNGSAPLDLYRNPFHTVARLRWLAEHETTNAARTAAVCLPHDWLTNRLLGSRKIAELVTDRSDASGTGYWSVLTGEYRMDRLRWALGHDAVVPGVLKPSEPAGLTHSGAVVGPGAGDNAAAALGIGAGPGDVIISIGTSGVVSAVAGSPIADPSGEVIDSADATGRFLRLASTPIAARVLDATAHMLGVGHGEFSRLALSAPPGSDGLVLLPFFAKAANLAHLRASGVVHGADRGQCDARSHRPRRRGGHTLQPR
jgi:xylulokinase